MLNAPHASAQLTWAFAGFALALALGVVWLTYAAGGRLGESRAVTLRWSGVTAALAAAWLSAAWLIADAGVIADFDRRPPPLAVLLAVLLVIAIVAAWSRFGSRLARAFPIWVLVATQAFRLPLELLMHEAAIEGVMPMQMSYTGWNFDIVTGATAIVVAPLLATGVGGRTLAIAWNVLGSVLLANILTIAVVSTPTFAAFGPARLNTWVAYPPFIWLPTVMVLCALTGHLLIWRKLAARSPASR